MAQVLACRDAQVCGWLAQVTNLDAAGPCQLGKLRVLGKKFVHAGFEVETGVQNLYEHTPPFKGQPAARDGHANERRRRAGFERKAVGDGGHNRNSLELGSCVRGVDHRRDRMRSIEDGTAGRLPVVGVEGLSLS